MNIARFSLHRSTAPFVSVTAALTAALLTAKLAAAPVLAPAPSPLSSVSTQPVSIPPVSTPVAGFVDVAAARGVVSDNSARTQLIDVDGDGWLDMVIGGAPFRILFSRPVPGAKSAPNETRVFVDGAAQTGLADRDHSMLAWGDVNGDGDLDAVSVVTQTAATFKTNPQTPAVYLGDGRGHFRREKLSGLEINHHTATHALVLCDLDLDGKLDVVFGNQYDGDGLEAQPMRVYRGDGRGHFSDVTASWGFPTRTVVPGSIHAPRPLYGLSAADVDNDGFPELLGAAYGRQWNTLWKRTASAPFYDDVAANYGVDGDAIRHGRYAQSVKDAQKKQGIEREDEPPFRTGGNTFSLVPADFDGDGDLDLFSAEITHWWAGDSSDLSCLLINQLDKRGEPFFARQLETLAAPDPETGRFDRAGLGLSRDHEGQTVSAWNQGDLQAHWADLDNDGLLDLLVCESDYPQNRLRLWLQKPDHTFVERDREVGLNWPNCPGVALGDIDGDGDLDIVATGSRTRWPEARPKPALALLENRLAPPQNGYLKLQLIGNGMGANSDAIGARVTLQTSDGKTQTREVSGPYGHWAAQLEPGAVHFGLGTATIVSVKIAWPDLARSVTLLSRETGDVPARNSTLTIRQKLLRP